MILADTDVLIDYLAEIQPAADRVREYISSDSLQTTAITCFELLSGAGTGRRGDRVRALVESIAVLALNRDAAVQAAAIRRAQSRTGFVIPMADSLIAGIALANGLSLFTRNRKHFEEIEGLQLE